MDGPAKDASRSYNPLPVDFIAAISKAELRSPRDLNPLTQTPYAMVATNTSPRTLLSITCGKWHIKVKILWIELSLALTPTRKKTVS